MNWTKISFNAELETAWGTFPINTDYPILYVDTDTTGGTKPALFHDSNFGNYTHRLIKQPNGSYLVEG